MMEIKRHITDEDIEWEYHQTYKNGEKWTEPRTTTVFEKEDALALMLINKVIFLNCYWWEEDWPERARKVTALCVNCNDVFAWGCADAEDLPYAEIENLYRMWRKGFGMGICSLVHHETQGDATEAR